MTKKVTTEDIKERLYNKVGEEYKVKSEYIKGNVNMDFFHTDCGEIFTTTPNHFFYDNRRCSCNTTRKNPYIFEKEFKEIAKEEYQQLTKYRRSTTKIKIKHFKCDNIFDMTPKDFLRGNRCPYCFGNRRKTTEEFKKEVLQKGEGEFILKSEYINNRSNVVVHHKGCGSDYYVTPKDFLNGNRCPFCKQSKGERKVERVLKDNKVTYEIQKVYEDLKVRGKYLPFDFYIPSKNLLIEYDGIQHSKPVEFFGGAKKLKDQQRRDNIKNNYAEKNNIDLLRIPYTYTDEEIKEVIFSYL
ncbi:hypothetical protein [Staphylococcus phage vB_SurM-PSU4]|nr:hypothetical protein [Staphylococcus phage vB_SurM-PSU4]